MPSRWSAGPITASIVIVVICLVTFVISIEIISDGLQRIIDSANRRSSLDYPNSPKLMKGALLALVPAFVIGLIVWSIDRWEPEPAIVYVIALGWGGGVSILIAFFGNRWWSEMISQWQREFGWDGKTVQVLKIAVGAGVVEELAKLRDMRKRCDVFLALNHMGVEEDKKLAERMPELDLIVGGHSHTRLDTGIVVNGVLITQAGEYLQYVGRTELTLRGRKVVARRNQLIPVASMKAEDAEVKAAIKKFYDESPLNEVIGRVTARIEGKEGLGNLVTDAEAAMNGADFAFQNAGGIRIGALEPGDMTAKMVYEMDPFGNEVNVVELTPEEMRDLIRVSHRYNKRRHAVDLLVSGMTYTLYTKNGEPDRIEMSFPDGRPLEEGRYYRVALNDYIVSAYKFPHARAAKPTGKSSEETIIEYIRSRKEIAPQAPRTKLIEE